MSIKKEKLESILDKIMEKKRNDNTVDMDTAVSYIWGLFTGDWEDDLATTSEELDTLRILYKDFDSANEFGIKSAEDVLHPSNSMYKTVLYIFDELGINYKPTREEFQLYFRKIYDLADAMISHERAEQRAKHFIALTNYIGSLVLPAEDKQTEWADPSLIHYYGPDNQYGPADLRKL